MWNRCSPRRKQWAGLQFAFWDIIHDGGDGFDQGMIRVALGQTTDAVVLGYAQTYLMQSLGQTTTQNFILNMSIISDGTPQQTLITAPPVPEPSSIMLTLIGAPVCGVLTRRRKKSL